VHQYVPGYFNDTTTGLPGNDDTGAMASFSAFVMMGLFPNPGQNLYFLTAPMFPEVSITNQVSGKVATVRTINFDPKGKNVYIQSVKYNGKDYTKSWIGHEFFTQGGTLEISVGETEGEWGTKDADVPPSPAGGGAFLMERGV
jgi:putative alpha-1,2-mannosidase